MIPADQFLLSQNEYATATELNLYLEKGTYIINVIDSDHLTIYSENISVD